MSRAGPQKGRLFFCRKIRSDRPISIMKQRPTLTSERVVMTNIERVLSALEKGKAPKLASVICEMLNETVTCGIDREASAIPPVMCQGWSVHISDYVDEAGNRFAIARCGGEQLTRAFQVEGLKFKWSGGFIHPRRMKGQSFKEFAPTLVRCIEGEVMPY